MFPPDSSKFNAASSPQRTPRADVPADSSALATSVALIIPAFDEEGAIGAVVEGFRSVVTEGGRSSLDEIVVVDNNSRDATAQRARDAGATVVHEPRPGYGSACLRGISYLAGERPGGPPTVVVFADGDGSNDPADLEAVVAPLRAKECEMVIGARPRRADARSLTVPQRFGNVLACRLMNALFDMRYTDLGPFRSITWSALTLIDMQDPDYGWTVEMQLKAAQQKLAVREVDVANHRRIAGKSKVSGTVKGVYGAGTKIIGTILRYR
jgi:glycosyltransferase involved in cell wall biosynthesis